MMKHICCDCGTEFYGANNARRCPKCREIRAQNKPLPPSEVDELMLDVREADAAGKSYGRWRADQLLAKQEARRRLEAKAKERTSEKQNQEKEG